MDIRHPLKNYDCQMLNWSAEAGLPVHILLTKSDKLKRGPAKNTLLEVNNFLREIDPQVSLLTVQTFSSLKRQGIAELENQLVLWLGADLPPN